MSRRLTNALLLVVVAMLVTTGLVAWLLPESRATPLYDIHRMSGIGLVLVLPWKELVAATSFARRLRRGIALSTTPGILATVALALTLVLGLAWTSGAVSFDRPIPYSAMNLHVFAGVALLPLAAWHVLQRWERPRARDVLARRAALRLVALTAVAVAVGAASAIFPPGRRVTGSKHAGSFTGNDFPLTIWRFDALPAIDPGRWRLSVTGPFADLTPFDLASLSSLPQREIEAIVDCTGGWWSEQRWRGVALRDVLAARSLAAGERSVTITSVTGHAWTFETSDLADAILATHVGGEPLSDGHGAPLRLVVPGRRGFQWIKWVTRIDVA